MDIRRAVRLLLLLLLLLLLPRRAVWSAGLCREDEPMTNNTRGVPLMIASMLAFTVTDAAIKVTSGKIPFSNCCFFAACCRACSSQRRCGGWGIDGYRCPVPIAS